MKTYGPWQVRREPMRGLFGAAVTRISRSVHSNWLGFVRETREVLPLDFSDRDPVALCRALNGERCPACAAREKEGCPTCAGKDKGCPAPSPSDAQRAFVSRLAGFGFMAPGPPKWDGVNRRKAERRQKRMYDKARWVRGHRCLAADYDPNTEPACEGCAKVYAAQDKQARKRQGAK